MKELGKRHYIIVLWLVLFSMDGRAQSNEDDNKDFESWYSASFDYKINKDWTVGLEEQLRLRDNSSNLDSYFTQFNVDYSGLGDFGLAGAFRYKRTKKKNESGDFRNNYRFHFDATYKHKIDRFSLKYRFRYQINNEFGNSDNTKQHLRLKAGLEYNIKKWKLDPKLTAEVFNHFLNDANQGLHKYRITLGTEYKFKNAGKIVLIYRYENNLKNKQNKLTSIVGIRYKFTLKNKK